MTRLVVIAKINYIPSTYKLKLGKISKNIINDLKITYWYVEDCQTIFLLDDYEIPFLQNLDAICSSESWLLNHLLFYCLIFKLLQSKAKGRGGVEVFYCFLRNLLTYTCQ